MKKETKINLIAVLTGIIIGWLMFNSNPTGQTTTKTTVTYDTITKHIYKTLPAEVKKIYITLPKDTLLITQDADTIITTVYREKQVKQYTYKDTLSNGILSSVILADNIYQRDISIQTFNKNTLTETHTTSFPSSLYFGGTIVSDINFSVKQAYINAVYVHKRNFVLTSGVGYDFDSANPAVMIGLALKF